MSECRCGKATRNDAYVCDGCADTLARALGDITWLDEELEITTSKQKAAVSGGGSPSSEKPMPLNWAASEARTALKGILVSWVRFCLEENVRHSSPVRTAPADNLVAISRWLMWRVDGLTLLDIGAEAVDEITDAVAACRRVIDKAPERKYGGPCVCGRDLYHRAGATTARCRECGEEYDVGELYNAMKAKVRGRLVTAREGATLLSRFDHETAQGTIDKWRERKLLVAHSTNSKGHRLYLFDDLLDLATRANAKRGA